MKVLVVLALTIAGVASNLESGFMARFGIGPGNYIKLPETETEAYLAGWLLTEVPSAVPGLKTAYCYPEYVVCIYFEGGYAAGLQAGLSVTNYTDSIYDWDVQGFEEWTAPNGEKFYTIKQYFVDEEYMSQDDATRDAKRDTSKLLQNDGVWVTGINKELVKVPITKQGLDDSDFTKQGCFPGMGTHYYYKMDKNTECTSETMFPYFALEYSNQLIGMGLVAFGKLPESPTRDWFERPPKLAVKLIVPSGPECLYEKPDTVGLVTMHVFYIKSPLRLNCLF